MSTVSPSSSNITIFDCTCVVCMEVFVEPIELPCKHELCRPCFDELRSSTLVAFECPQCRVTLNEWYAKQHLNSSAGLVNVKRWLLIKRTFHDEVETRLKGRSAQIVAESIKNYNQYGIVDSVYASVVADFDLKRMIRDEERKSPVPARQRIDTLPPSTKFASHSTTDSFDIHEFLRREKEEEEKANMDAIEKLLKEENNLSVNDYVDLYERSYVSGIYVDSPRKKPRVPARRVAKARRTATPSKTVSVYPNQILQDTPPTPPSPLFSVISNREPTSPNLDSIIEAVASGQIGRTSTTRVSTNDIVVTSSGGAKKGSKRKLGDTITSTIDLPNGSSSTIITNSAGATSYSSVQVVYEAGQKRIKVNSSSSFD